MDVYSMIGLFFYIYFFYFKKKKLIDLIAIRNNNILVSMFFVLLVVLIWVGPVLKDTYAGQSVWVTREADSLLMHRRAARHVTSHPDPTFRWYYIGIYLTQHQVLSTPQSNAVPETKAHTYIHKKIYFFPIHPPRFHSFD